MVWRESDLLVVHRGRESRSHGEGADRKTQPTQETWSGLPCVGAPRPTSLRGIATKTATSFAEASLSEEPGAEKLHAGICAGGVGQPASLIVSSGSMRWCIDSSSSLSFFFASFFFLCRFVDSVEKVPGPVESS